MMNSKRNAFQLLIISVIAAFSTFIFIIYHQKNLSQKPSISSGLSSKQSKESLLNKAEFIEVDSYKE